ncbi:MAG: SCP2 sterol-binding domain-containing protein [Oscillospiraceae bacterium]|nr:SCP2 sterol-binding domain-containing protein [Oscillospiraceae bacterium]
MTYEEIFAKAESLFAKGDATGFDGDFAIQVNITGEGEGAFYIAYKNGALDVAPYEYHDRDAILFASAENFLKIADGSLGAVPAFLSGKLKVEGSTEKALELDKLITFMKKKAKEESKSAPKAADKKGKKK